jgi:hypothetical protein
MTKRVCLWALLALLLCLESAEAKDQWVVRGDGQASCGAWTKAQAHRPHIGVDNKLRVTFADMDLASQTAWVSGFLSAFDYYGNGSGNVGNDIDANGILAWIDNYCVAHPLDSIATATIALVSELSKRAGQ